MFKIGLPKGVVKESSLQFVQNFLNMQVDPDRLCFSGDNVTLYLLKQRDIPGLLHRERLDVGITSSDWVGESNFPLVSTHQLEWCNTRLSLLSPPDAPVLTGTRVPIRCVTEYPNTARRFFRSVGVRNVRIEHLSGSIEGLIPSLYDCGIDCVETGYTARLHALAEEQVILHAKVGIYVKGKQLPRLEHLINTIVESILLVNVPSTS